VPPFLPPKLQVAEKYLFDLPAPSPIKKNALPKMRLEVRARAITRVYAHMAMRKHTDISLPSCGPLQTLLLNVLSSRFGSADASHALFAPSRTMAAAANIPVINLSSLRVPLIARKRRASYTSAGSSRDDMCISLHRDQREAEDWKTLTDNQLMIANAVHADDADEEHAIHVRKNLRCCEAALCCVRMRARSCLFFGHSPHGSWAS